MNTEHLFGIYLAKRRMAAAEQRRRPASAPCVSYAAEAARRAADREAASLRVFDAIRAAVESRIRR